MPAQLAARIGYPPRARSIGDVRAAPRPLGAVPALRIAIQVSSSEVSAGEMRTIYWHRTQPPKTHDR